ncbi:MAG: protein kinase domain-containing protein, partial [Limisphaerales bacterium]
MNETKKCPKCEAELPADAPEGLCPACLMENGVESEAETMASGSSPDAGPAKITPSIARLFPNLDMLECLGQGGMGVVYKARQKQLDRLVAVKVMKSRVANDPAFAERFTREARALAKLNHPNIVAAYDADTVGNVHFLVMEYVRGTDLDVVAKKEDIIGGIGGGFKTVLKGMNAERVLIASECIGDGRYFIDKATEYAS